MTNIPTEVLDKVRAALEALCAHLPLPTEGNYKSAEIHEEESFTCPVCDGNGEVEGEQFINFDNHALNVLFTGIGDEHVKWQKLFDALVKSAPQLREALTALEAALREPVKVDTAQEKIGTETIIGTIQQWLDWQEGVFAKEGKQVADHLAFYSVPNWPSRGMWKAWIKHLQGLQNALSATQPTETGKSGEEAKDIDLLVRIVRRAKANNSNANDDVVPAGTWDRLLKTLERLTSPPEPRTERGKGARESAEHFMGHLLGNGCLQAPPWLVDELELAFRNHAVTPPEPRNGWQWVPKEPTEEMIEACHTAMRDWVNSKKAANEPITLNKRPYGYKFNKREKHIIRYKAMLAAVPQAPDGNGWQPRPLRELIAEGHDQAWVWLKGACYGKGDWCLMYDTQGQQDFLDCPAVAILKPASPPCVGGKDG